MQNKPRLTLMGITLFIGIGVTGCRHNPQQPTLPPQSKVVALGD